MGCIKKKRRVSTVIVMIFKMLIHFILMWCLWHSHQLRYEGVQEYGSEEDIWVQEGHGKRGIEKSTLIRRLTICTPYQILFG
jgi:hypothetical protein